MDVAYYVDLADGPRLAPSDDASEAGRGGAEKGPVPRAVLCPVFSNKRCDAWFFGYPLFYFFADVPADKLIGPFASTHLLVLSPRIVDSVCDHCLVRVGTLSGRHGEITDNQGDRYHGDRVKMYNDVFIKIFVALFGCKPEVPDNFRAARLLYARLRSMTTRIGDGEFDAMVSRLRIEIRLAWATVAEMYEEVASGGALEGDMVIQRLHPKPEQCFLKYDHTVPYREQELTIWSAELRALIEAMHAALAKFEPYASGGDHREFPELFRSAWGDLLRSFGLNPTPCYSPKPVYPKIITRKLHGRALLLTRDVLWWHNAPHEAERRLRDFRNPYALANKLFREEGKRRAKAMAKAKARAAAERRGEVYTHHSSSEDEGGSVPTFAEAMGVRAVCVPRPSLLVSVLRLVEALRCCILTMRAVPRAVRPQDGGIPASARPRRYTPRCVARHS
jgi:hypothetical protein